MLDIVVCSVKKEIKQLFYIQETNDHYLDMAKNTSTCPTRKFIYTLLSSVLLVILIGMFIPVKHVSADASA